MIEDDFDIKKKVEEVLNETGFTEQRVAKMDVDDLLKCVPILLVFYSISLNYVYSGYSPHFTTLAYTSHKGRNLDSRRFASKSSVTNSGYGVYEYYGECSRRCSDGVISQDAFFATYASYCFGVMDF